MTGGVRIRHALVCDAVLFMLTATSGCEDHHTELLLKLSILLQPDEPTLGQCIDQSGYSDSGEGHNRYNRSAHRTLSRCGVDGAGSVVKHVGGLSGGLGCAPSMAVRAP